MYCCIDYVLVFALSTIIFDAYGTASKLNTGAQPTRSGNRQNLVSSQPIKLELGSVFIRIERTTRLGHYIVPFYPGTVLKNRVYVYKYCLVKHDLNCIVQSFSFTEHNRFECGLDRHVDNTERYNPLQQRSFILYIHAVL